MYSIGISPPRLVEIQTARLGETFQQCPRRFTAVFFHKSQELEASHMSINGIPMGNKEEQTYATNSIMLNFTNIIIIGRL